MEMFSQESEAWTSYSGFGTDANSSPVCPPLLGSRRKICCTTLPNPCNKQDHSTFRFPSGDKLGYQRLEKFAQSKSERLNPRFLTRRGIQLEIWSKKMDWNEDGVTQKASPQP